MAVDCPQHPGNEAADFCATCNASICQQCKTSFGPYCSQACVNEAQTTTAAPKKAGKTAADQLALTMKLMKLFMLSIVLLVVAGAGYFGYRLFLDPVGRIDWRWAQAGNLSETQIITHTDDIVYVQAGNAIHKLSTKDGISHGTLNNPDFAAVTTFHRSGDGFLGVAPTQLVRISATGQTLSTIDLPGATNQLYLNDATTFAIIGSTTIIQSEEDRLAQEKAEAANDYNALYQIAARRTYQTELIGIDLSSGETRWTKPIPEGIAISFCELVGDTAFIVFTKRAKDYSATHVLAGYQLSDGSRAWKQKLDDVSYDTLSIAGDFILIRNPAKLSAVDTAGAEQWSLPINAADDPDFFVKNDVLFAQIDGSTLCYELKTGNPLFPISIEASENSVFVSDAYIFVSGTQTTSENVNVAKMPGFNQAPDVLEDFGLNNPTIDHTKPILVCLDKASGNVKWRKENTYGRLMFDGERLIIYWDTAETAMFSMMKSSSETVIRQIDPDDGSYIVNKTFLEGIAQPTLVGNHLIGIEYNTEEYVLKNKPSAAEAMSGNEGPKVNTPGLISIRVK